MVNINQMKFLIEIVRSNFNLTEAADQLYVSQSALSQFIKKIESENNLNLFERRKGRIVGLTSSGYKVYEQSLKVIDQYVKFENILTEEVEYQKGTVRIGVHSTILRLFFTKFIPKFMNDNPQANIEIIEAGPLSLQNQLLEGRLQMAILVEPLNLDLNEYEQNTLIETEVVAFMMPSHPLANRDFIKWQDLIEFVFITYNQEDPVHDELKNKLAREEVESKPLFTSISFDYLIESLYSLELLAILPSVKLEQFQSRISSLGLVERRFEKPIRYKPSLVRPRKKHYSTIESFFYNSIIEYFYLEDESLRYNFLAD